MSWRSRTCSRLPISSSGFTSEQMVWTAGYLWRSRPCWPGTRRPLWPRPRLFTPARGGPISSSRSLEPARAFQRLKKRIFAGVPVNVTLLFSGEQYVAAAEASVRGIERRISAGLNPDVGSVASLFVSRWDVAVADKAPEALRNQLGIAIARDAYVRYRTLLDSPRLQRILNEGARPQRLLWASTGTKDTNASDILYVEALALPFTINTMPEATLKALAAHEEFGEALPLNPGEKLAEFAKAGIDTDALAAQLLEEGVASFAKSWKDLLDCIASKSQVLKAA